MLNRSLKLFVIIYFSVIFNCLSQNKADSLNNAGIVNQYNNYLKAIKMDTWLNADDFSFYRKFVQINAQGQIKLDSVNVLTLQPNARFNDPIQFLTAWNDIVNLKKNGGYIYNQLFLNLATFTGKPPGSLVIRIGTDTTGTSSYLVYYNTSIRVIEPLIDAKGIPGNTHDLPASNGPGDLNNSLYGGFFREAPYTLQLKANLITGIIKFLKGNKQNGGTVLKPQLYGSGMVVFTVKNTKGRITPKYYEIITVELNLDPLFDQSTADISFSFNVVFSSGPVDLSNYYKYENAIAYYPVKVSDYGANLKAIIHDVIYGKSK